MLEIHEQYSKQKNKELTDMAQKPKFYAGPALESLDPEKVAKMR